MPNCQMIWDIEPNTLRCDVCNQLVPVSPMLAAVIQKQYDALVAQDPAAKHYLPFNTTCKPIFDNQKKRWIGRHNITKIKNEPCRSRGKKIGETFAKACCGQPGKGPQLDVYECARHRHCTLFHANAERTIQVCMRCPDYFTEETCKAEPTPQTCGVGKQPYKDTSLPSVSQRREFYQDYSLPPIDPHAFKD